MTRDELIEAAAKARYAYYYCDPTFARWDALRDWEKKEHCVKAASELAIYESLIRADERAKENEACAQVAEKPHEHGGDGWAAKHEVALAGVLSEGIATAIRARMEEPK